jgi:hypothetical protein
MLDEALSSSALVKWALVGAVVGAMNASLVIATGGMLDVGEVKSRVIRVALRVMLAAVRGSLIVWAATEFVRGVSDVRMPVLVVACAAYVAVGHVTCIAMHHSVVAVADAADALVGRAEVRVDPRAKAHTVVLFGVVWATVPLAWYAAGIDLVDVAIWSTAAGVLALHSRAIGSVIEHAHGEWSLEMAQATAQLAAAQAGLLRAREDGVGSNEAAAAPVSREVLVRTARRRELRAWFEWNGLRLDVRRWCVWPGRTAVVASAVDR